MWLRPLGTQWQASSTTTGSVVSTSHAVDWSPLVLKRSSKLQAKSLPPVTPVLPTADCPTAGLKYRLGRGEAAVQRAYRSGAR